MKSIIRHVNLIFFQPKISLAILLVFTACTVGITWRVATYEKDARESDLLKRYDIGTEVRTHNYALTVESVRHDSQGAGPYTPRPGYEFIIPTITLKNNSDMPFDFIPLLFLHIKDEQGNIYNVVAVPTEGNQLSGSILAHDLIREEIGFEVVRGASRLTLYFESGAPDYSTIAIDLESRQSWWSRLNFFRLL